MWQRDQTLYTLHTQSLVGLRDAFIPAKHGGFVTVGVCLSVSTSIIHTAHLRCPARPSQPPLVGRGGGPIMSLVPGEGNPGAHNLFHV